MSRILQVLRSWLKWLWEWFWGPVRIPEAASGRIYVSSITAKEPNI